MFYSSYNKVDSILKYYNIEEITTYSNQAQYTMILKNLKSGGINKLKCDQPLYNVIYCITKESVPIMQEETFLFNIENACFIYQELIEKLALFGNSVYLNLPTDKKTMYYKRFNTFKWTGISYSSKFYNYFNNYNINTILEISNITDTTVVDILGLYILESNNNVRLLLNPINEIISNVDKVYYSNFDAFRFNNVNYAQITLIYTTRDDPDNVKLYYKNNFLNTIVGTQIKEISLSGIFDNYINSFKNIIENDDNIDKIIFIKNTIFNLGIFINTPNGIVRYIPYKFNKQFYNIIYNTIKWTNDYSYNLYCNDIQVRLKNKNDRSDLNSLCDYDVSSIKSNKNNNIIFVKYIYNIATQRIFNNLNIFENILDIKSNASQYNDILFSITNETTDVPIILTENGMGNN